MSNVTSVGTESLDRGDTTKPTGAALSLLDKIMVTSKPADPNEVTVGEALAASPVLGHATGRKKSRVLFVTSDQSIFDINSSKRRQYLLLAEVFDEVHVMVLVTSLEKVNQERLGKNIWLYKTIAMPGKKKNQSAINAAFDLLTFNNSVRPDVVIGTDPYEAGWSAYKIAEAFKRPVQIYVDDNFLSPEFTKLNPNNKIHSKLARSLIKRVGSVRVKTENIKEAIQTNFKKVTDVQLRPQFYNFTGLREATPTSDVHDIYKDFSLVLVAQGPLTADSHLHDVFTATQKLLQNKTIGMLVIGTGPMMKLFEEKVALLDIKEQVVFIKQTDNMVSILKTADILVEADVTTAGDVRVMQAAAAGLPVVSYETEVRKDLFKDGESAYLCAPDDPNCLMQKINALVNAHAMRKKFSHVSQDIAESRLVEDEDAYVKLVQQSVESIVQ